MTAAAAGAPAGAAAGAAAAEQPHVLIFLGEAADGRRLAEAVRDRANAGVRSFSVVAPRGRPGLDAVLAALRELGIEAEGEVGDPHPALALDDAVRAWRPSEIIVWSRPECRFGLLRRDLVEHARARYAVPVEHLVADPVEV